MKERIGQRVVVWIFVLVASIAVCRLSEKVERASHATILFEHPDRPITLTRLVGIALGRERSYSGNACINNLRQIDATKNEWALEFNKKAGDVIARKDVVPYMKERPWCPQGGIYRLGRIGELPTCSITNHFLP